MGEQPLLATISDGVATLTINRAEKRNAMNSALLKALEDWFSEPPEEARVVILHGAGGHYCAGLDLDEASRKDAEGIMRHSRWWHAVMDKIQFSGLPVVSAMQGAVIGGGLELATATHVRVAEPSVRFQLPEGRRGIFVGGGATVRVGRIIGPDRMTEMMLTGRTYGADEGLALGLAHYAVGEGEAFAKARELAAEIAKNAKLCNYVMINAIARIGDMSAADGFFTESMCAALTQTSPDALEGLNAFLEKRAPRFR